MPASDPPFGSSPPPPASSPAPAAAPPSPLKEALVVFALAIAAAATLYHLSFVVPYLDQALHFFVALVFLAAPTLVARRRGEDLVDYGFTRKPLLKGLAYGLVPLLVIFPLFIAGYVLFYEVICANPAGLGVLAPPGFCRHFAGWDALADPRLPKGPLDFIAGQLVVVALPEELFFRGYLLKRLEEAFPPKRRLLGGGVGWALLLSAGLFALGHVLVDLDPRRLAVFFPGLLFGWMRSATGSILAGTLAHASSNVFIELLNRTFLH